MNFGTFGLPQGLGLSSGLFGLPASNILWTPSVISPKLWFDAADSSTITESFGLITEWRNKGTESTINATATGGQRPTYGSYQLNQLNLVSVRGSGIGMNTAYIVDAPYSIVLVSRNYSDGRVLQSASNNSVISPSRSTGTAFNVANVNVRDAALTTFGQWSIVTMQIEGASPSQLWYNSLNYASGTHGYWGGLTIGSGIFNDNPDAEIAEILVLNNSLPTETRQKLEGYLSRKWGLLSDLSADHPYKNTPPLT